LIELCKLLLGTFDVPVLTVSKDIMSVCIINRRSDDLYSIRQLVLLCFVLSRKNSLICYSTILSNSNCRAEYFICNKSLSAGRYNSSLIGVSLNGVIVALKYINYSLFGINDFLISTAYRGTGTRR
jgi:hypothetical protein